MKDIVDFLDELYSDNELIIIYFELEILNCINNLYGRLTQTYEKQYYKVIESTSKYLFQNKTTFFNNILFTFDN